MRFLLNLTLDGTDKLGLSPRRILSKYCMLCVLVDHLPGGGGGGKAIYVPYGDVPPIRVYFLAFESETGCLFSSLTLK